MPLKTNALLVKAALLLSSGLAVMVGATIAPSLLAMGDYFATTLNADYRVRLVLTVPFHPCSLRSLYPLVGTMIHS